MGERPRRTKSMGLFLRQFQTEVYDFSSNNKIVMNKTHKITNNKKKPRKIMNVKPSQYETSEALHTNKMYWKNIFNEIETTSDTPGINVTEKLSEILPNELYEKVCNVLNIPVDLCDSKKLKKVSDEKSRKCVKEPMLSYRKTICIERELDSDTDVEISLREDVVEEVNVHQEFLKKPEREQITWPTRYLQPEREDEKTLVRKADDLTDRIAVEFCEYMTQLGGNQQSQLFTPKSVKELFQIEFDTHVARGLQVVTKELPTIDEKIAKVTGNAEKSKYATLQREVTKDIRAELRPDYLTAFGRNIPRKDQWRAPNNNTKSLWRPTRYVPKDLVTLKTVWEGITNLRSVREYCRWMIEHPEYRRAPYLSSLGMFDPAVLEARLALEAQHGVLSPNPTTLLNVPAPIDHIRRRLSQLADS